MLARYGRRVWKIENEDDRTVAESAIGKAEDFMRSMGCPVRIRDAVAGFDPDALIHHLYEARQTAVGENGEINTETVRRILAHSA